MFNIVSQLMTIMTLLDKHKEQAFQMGMIMGPTIQLLKSIGRLYANPYGWQMRLLRFVEFFSSFSQKSKAIFKL
jgi:hypothetical protein